MKNLLKKIVVYILQKEAEAVLKKYKPRIIGITGSVGKTSTKDTIYSALCNFYICRKSQKSFNSEFGVPLTILGITNVHSVNMSLSSVHFWLQTWIKGLELILLPNIYPEWLVLEIGTDRPGDIEAVTKWVKPDIAVVTKLSKTPVHVEFFPSPKDLFEEKGNLVRALKPGGYLILNSDDEDVLEYKKLTQEKVLLFGNNSEADVRGSNYQLVFDKNKHPQGIQFDIEVGDQKFPVNLNRTIGIHHTYPILAAMAVVKALNENLEIATKNISKHETTPGRMRLIDGVNGSVIIDDTYNSSPIALTEALLALKCVKSKRKIAVIGDMLELGKYSVDAHKQAGEEASQIADILITVGVRSKDVALSAKVSGMNEENIFHFEDSSKAGEFLRNIVKKGDTVLIKGSQGIRMEKTVAEIMLEPKKAKELLVRQDGFWKYK